MSASPIFVLGIGERVALRDQRRGIVVQDHVHARQTTGRRVLFLTVERDGRPRFIPHLEQQRPRSACRVVDGCLRARLRLTDADDLRHDLADFGRRVELSLALAALRGEVPHQVLVRIAQNVIAFGAVLREIQRLVLEDGDQVRQPVHHLLAAAELVRVIEIGEIRKLVGIRQRRDDLLIDLVADIGLALQRHHILETRPLWNGDRRIRLSRILIADVLDEQQHQHIILILRSIHPAAQFVTTCPEGGVEFRFFDWHDG